MNITPTHQRIAAELAEAAVLGDAQRIDTLVDDLRTAGVNASLAVNAVLTRSLGATLVDAYGRDLALRVLESTKLDAALAEPDNDK